MEYYEMRRRAASDLRNYLEHVDTAVKNNTEIPDWNEFKSKMLLKYGFGEKTIDNMLQQFGLTITKEGEVAKIA